MSQNWIEVKGTGWSNVRSSGSVFKTPVESEPGKLKSKRLEKYMKKSVILAFAIVCFGTLSLRAAFYDGTIDMTAGLRDISFGGGEFKATVKSTGPGSGLNGVIGNVVAGEIQFGTFCLETTESISLGGAQSYRVKVSDAAINGGISGGNPDPISRATAWLYWHFRNNTLAGLGAGYTVSQAGNRLLQEAIWFLEGEGGIANSLVAKAQLALGATYLSSANGEFGVRVLNVWKAGDINAAPLLSERLQDQLVLVPEPSTYVAGALLLIPVLAQLRRWKRVA